MAEVQEGDDQLVLRTAVGLLPVQTRRGGHAELPGPLQVVTHRPSGTGLSSGEATWPGVGGAVTPHLSPVSGDLTLDPLSP